MIFRNPGKFIIILSAVILIIFLFIIVITQSGRTFKDSISTFVSSIKSMGLDSWMPSIIAGIVLVLSQVPIYFRDRKVLNLQQQYTLEVKEKEKEFQSQQQKTIQAFQDNQRSLSEKFEERIQKIAFESNKTLSQFIEKMKFSFDEHLQRNQHLFENEQRNRSEAFQRHLIEFSEGIKHTFSEDLQRNQQSFLADQRERNEIFQRYIVELSEDIKHQFLNELQHEQQCFEDEQRRKSEIFQKQVIELSEVIKHDFYWYDDICKKVVILRKLLASTIDGFENLGQRIERLQNNKLVLETTTIMKDFSLFLNICQEEQNNIPPMLSSILDSISRHFTEAFLAMAKSKEERVEKAETIRGKITKLTNDIQCLDAIYDIFQKEYRPCVCIS